MNLVCNISDKTDGIRESCGSPFFKKGTGMRFIHTADIHLGAEPDKGFRWSQQRSEEIWQTFRRLIRRTQEEQADLLLIAGDLFHRQPLNRELKEVNYLLGRLTQTRVVLMMGNHDYLTQDSNYRDFPWAENVVCLDGKNCERVTFPDLNAYVYGFSYHDREITEPLYDSLRPGPEAGYHILLAHGGDANHIPIDKGKLAASGFDYIALGHIHKPGFLVKNRMAYAGSLEPLDKNETGEHGFILGTCENGRVTACFEPFACRNYVHVELESSGEMTGYAMQEKIIGALERYGRNQLYQFLLTGYRDPDIRYETEKWMSLGNILEIADHTEPEYNLEELKRIHGDDVVGRFLDRLENPAGLQESEIQKLAVYYGVSALLQRD